MITYCDVNTCEDCPRYGDDCDGDKKVEHTDYISRADAIEAVRLETSKLGRGLLGKGDILDIIEALPSADAVSREDYHNLLMASNDIDRALREYQAKEETDAVDCTEFIEWLVDRVLDETIWENNSVAYGEIICRKLEKLGVLEVTEEPSYYIRPSADAVQGGDAEMDNCQVQAPQNYMQQSRHDDGKDLISRADAMGAVQDHFNADGFKGYDDGQKMMDRIKALPSADAVQGEWEKTTDGNGWNEWHVLKCPLCDATIEDKQNRKWEYNYCPSCGARMKGGTK